MTLSCSSLLSQGDLVKQGSSRETSPSKHGLQSVSHECCSCTGPELCGLMQWTCVQDRAVGQLLGHTRFTSPDDTLILEDESARMPLTGEALQPGTFVTGVVMAVRGTATPGTEGFHVQASLQQPHAVLCGSQVWTNAFSGTGHQGSNSSSASDSLCCSAPPSACPFPSHAACISLSRPVTEDVNVDTDPMYSKRRTSVGDCRKDSAVGSGNAH